MKLRADHLLVQRGLFESRTRAKAAIEAGLVVADGIALRKASALVAEGAELAAGEPHPWVSRGGIKLVVGLDAFGIDPQGLVCLDVGASTGGFTDVLLARGAAHVVAVDVGHGQLHARLRGDARVTSLEGRDVRALDAAALPAPPRLATVDVSFIPLHVVLPAVARLLAPEAALVVLVKPQFEAGRAALKKGVVRDAGIREAVVAGIAVVLGGLGFAVSGPIPSPIAGGDGNLEFLLAGRR